jgi:2'-deoxynucleoside 5'-phosphate N-hydrolase
MKVCLVASIKNKDVNVEYYREIVKVLKGSGDKVFYEHVLNYSQADLDSLSEDKRVQFHKRVMDLVKKSDLVVAEITSQSLSVGFLISMALDLSKPTILLYRGNSKPNIISTLEESDKLLVGKYSDQNDIEGVLNGLLNKAKGKSDVRFNFFVSPKILAYLDWVAQKRMVPRSVFLRDLIEKEMKKDKEFKE